MTQIISDLIKFHPNHRANVTIYEEHFYRLTFEWFSCVNSSRWKIWTSWKWDTKLECMLLVKLFKKRIQCMQWEWHRSIYDDGDENETNGIVSFY